MTRRLLLPVLCAAIFFVGCDWDDIGGDRNRYKEEFAHSYPLKSGGRIELDNFNGSVEIAAWDQETVEITGSKYANTQDLLNAIKIDIVAAPDSIRIKTVRPSERRGSMGARYVLRVPKRVMLDRIMTSNGTIRLTGADGDARLLTSNGSVRINNVTGNIDAKTSNASVEVGGFSGSAIVRTSNGGIRVEGVKGYFEAHTSNASIDARLAAMDPDRPIRLETSNGSINISLPEMRGHQIYAHTSNATITVQAPSNAGGQIRATTSNGSIQTEFDVNVRGQISKSRLEGNFGTGIGLLDLSTSNGNIRIVRM